MSEANMKVAVPKKKMSEANVAFQEWKKKWNKKYDSFCEENTRFGDFRINFYDEIKYSDDPPETKPLWDVLNEYADRPFKEHFGYIRLDRNMDSMSEANMKVAVPKKKMSEANVAFQEWKKKWNKQYDSFCEENTRFGDFRINFYEEIKYSDDPPEGKPLWDVLNEYADRPFTEHFGYIRLDRNMDSDEDSLPEDLISGCMFPVKQKDGTITMEWSKIQSAVALPVKRPSSSDDNKDDTKEDLDDATLKRPKIGCGGQKPGCCSDRGK